jgi:hypothetical protein
LRHSREHAKSSTHIVLLDQQAADMIEASTATPLIGRTYPLADAPEAVRELERGHTPRQAGSHRADLNARTRFGASPLEASAVRIVGPVDLRCTS